MWENENNFKISVDNPRKKIYNMCTERGEQMAIKATSTAKMGKDKVNALIRFNVTALSKTEFEIGDNTFIEYHSDKIVIRKIKE